MQNRPHLTLEEVSGLDAAAFTAHFGQVFEHSAWIADHAWSARPFASIEALHASMVQAARDAGPDALLALLRLHPELAAPGAPSGASATEQAGAGLGHLDAVSAGAFETANLRYRERFGFPFIIAVRGQREPAAILSAMQRRLENPAAVEFDTAFEEVARIARYRLEDLVAPAGIGTRTAAEVGTGSGTQDFLTVHVLDVTRGRPAAGLAMILSRDGQPLASAVTNADGRCEGPLLAGDAMRPGIYEIVFDVEGWRGGEADAGFYDRITVRFRLMAGCGHVHIPLLLSPYGYSTYRGS